MAKFKIGITAIGYDCREHLDLVFDAWKQVKEGVIGEYVESLDISFAHGCFEETAKLGYPILSTDGTIEWLKIQKDNGLIDNLQIFDTPQKEYDMWTSNLPFLRENGVDLLFMINADEVWNVIEIARTLEYIQNAEFIDYFKVNFQNFCIDTNHFVTDFIVPRVWHMNVQGGLKGFYRDDLVEYNNGKKDVEISSKIVPPGRAFPKHFSWVGSKAYLKRKLAFQHLRYGTCSYRWNEAEDHLELNPEHYQKYGIPEPTIYEI